MLLNVEYMMELMDPALQLGEGELTTALRHHTSQQPRPVHSRQPSKDFLGRAGLRLSPRDITQALPK